MAILGVFGLHSGKSDEAPGTLGASIQLLDRDELIAKHDLVNGIHYSDAFDLRPIDATNGDGSCRKTVGTCEIGGALARVDLLEIDVAPERIPDTVLFKDLGSPASFAVFDLFLRSQPIQGCPFRSDSGGFPLSDLGPAVRVGDRVKFGRALDQLYRAMRSADSLDEARGQALTFLAVVTAALIDLGGDREMHLTQLRTARSLESATSRDEAVAKIECEIERLTPTMFAGTDNLAARIVDRSLAIVDRYFAKELSDSAVAAQVGLSTSHFRFLFREATGQPFHRYLVAVRLEKARAMLIDQALPVSRVATAVGFSGLSHFSRAFSTRFSVSPTSVRRASG